MNSNQRIGFAVLEVATVAGSAVPGVGPFLEVGFTAFGVALKMLTGDEDQPPQGINEELLRSTIKDVIENNTAREYANNIASSYSWYKREMQSWLWPEGQDQIPPTVSEPRLKELREQISRATEGISSLQTSITGLEDPQYGKYFLSGLVMGQSLNLQYHKLLVVLDRWLKYEHRDRIRKLINLCRDYAISVDRVRRAADEDIYKQLLQAPPPRNEFVARKDQLLKEIYQGNPDLVFNALNSYRLQERDWRLVQSKLPAN